MTILFYLVYKASSKKGRLGFTGKFRKSAVDTEVSVEGALSQKKKSGLDQLSSFLFVLGVWYRL